MSTMGGDGFPVESRSNMLIVGRPGAIMRAMVRMPGTARKYSTRGPTSVVPLGRSECTFPSASNRSSTMKYVATSESSVSRGSR